jgi:uncharacterized protein (TIGR03435 family)
MKTMAHMALGMFVLLTPVVAQVPPDGPTFDVVSIKRVDELRQSGGMRILPDGTFMMTGQPIGSLLNLASPVPVTPRDITGGPDWLWRELYDVTVKPPERLTGAELAAARPMMWRAMFADRMRLVAHIEQREKDAFVLVLARSDGRLGPDMKPSTLDCTRPDGTAPTPPPASLPSPQERESRCGLFLSGGQWVSGGVALDQLARTLGGIAGGEVNNRTGLTGLYSIKLNFSAQGRAGTPPDPNAAAAVDDAPNIFTALQEQLGLKLQRGQKKSTPVFVIDSIERPSEN